MKTKPVDSTAAGRLCSACGLCCNGVLFQRVRLLPGEASQPLAALGFKIKRRDGNLFFQQPCPAFCDSTCSIYEQRPSRCRSFECRLLRWLLAGEITEAEALTTVGSARQWVTEVDRLLELAGEPGSGKSLLKRFENATAESVDENADPERTGLLDELMHAGATLNRILDEHFRNDAR